MYEYKIVHSPELTALEDAINGMAAKGWQAVSNSFGTPLTVTGMKIAQFVVLMERKKDDV